MYQPCVPGRSLSRAAAWVAPLLLAGAVAAKANLLRNPSFEDGALEGWQTSGQNWRTSSFANDEVMDYRGGRVGVVCDVHTNDVDEWRYLGQRVPAREGLRYSAGAWVRLSQIEDAEVYLEIKFLDARGEVVEQYQSEHLTANQSFTELVLDDVRAPKGTAMAALGAVVRMKRRPEIGTGFAVFDDFEFDVIQNVNRGPSRFREPPRLVPPDEPGP